MGAGGSVHGRARQILEVSSSSAKQSVSSTQKEIGSIHVSALKSSERNKVQAELQAFGVRASDGLENLSHVETLGKRLLQALHSFLS